jgi:tetratricopeptide (TPR) repeat protein
MRALTLLALVAGCAASPLVHPRAAEELRRGYAHLQARDAERAEVAFEHALEFAPDLAEGWNGLGVVARTRGDLEAARRRFGRAVRLAPDFAEGHANLGEVLLALERPAEAVDGLRAALRIDPDLAGARLNLARALLQAGLLDPAARPLRWREARREYLHLQEADPESATASQDLGFMDYLDARPAAAEAGYRRAVERAPTPEALLGLCLSLVRLGRCAEGRAACDRCLELAPGYESCRVSRRGAMACE